MRSDRIYPEPIPIKSSAWKDEAMPTYSPTGVSLTLGLNEFNDPLVSLVFQVGFEEDAIEMVLNEPEVSAVITLTQEGLVRAQVMREMITMFPDKMDEIVATLMFRWTGSIDGA